MPGQLELVNNTPYSFIRDEALRLDRKYSMPIALGGAIPETINSKGWVYILSNPFMPGLLKVGMTTTSPTTRAKELSAGTGVPAKFVVEASYFSEDPRGDEAKIHKDLSKYRVNNGREFFQCSIAQAHEICRAYCLCETKSSLEEVANDYVAICVDKPIKLDLHEWFEEFCIPHVGCSVNVARMIFELGCERLDAINRDGISIIIENGQMRGIMTESHQSYIAYLEECHEREMSTGVFGPREQAGF
ncbi:GIY-YIG nuclease family protein [Pantoea dispersa]|uniref:GIY-YIG nuclease family protein n=1 Tax=Pantoea dispersa TaxID=59814 RepID=UPI000F682558|nr:GIY-YIG nuclease family protein [Pantoea dispersa]RRW77647.1 GIY-YIG nuclease family protein [Pantoea dispersa]